MTQLKEKNFSEELKKKTPVVSQPDEFDSDEFDSDEFDIDDGDIDDEDIDDWDIDDLSFAEWCSYAIGGVDRVMVSVRIHPLVGFPYGYNDCYVETRQRWDRKHGKWVLSARDQCGTWGGDATIKMVMDQSMRLNDTKGEYPAFGTVPRTGGGDEWCIFVPAEFEKRQQREITITPFLGDYPRPGERPRLTLQPGEEVGDFLNSLPE